MKFLDRATRPPTGILARSNFFKGGIYMEFFFVLAGTLSFLLGFMSCLYLMKAALDYNQKHHRDCIICHKPMTYDHCPRCGSADVQNSWICEHSGALRKWIICGDCKFDSMPQGPEGELLWTKAE